MTEKHDNIMINKVDLKKNKGKVDAKKVLIGAGARILFYPTLLYNVLRFKIQSDFRWWDQIDQFLLMGAVPFRKDVAKLKQLGVGGVITLNEPFETLVQPSLYEASGMKHLVIPTRDYLYAPSFDDINTAVDFIHSNASCGQATYVHCKAGRGRSTTIALCYLIKYKQMTPSTAMELIRSKRPRVLLHSMQAKAVQQYYRSRFPCSPHSQSSDGVLITEADLEGYRESFDNTDKLELMPPAGKTLPITMRLSSLINSLTIACSCVSISGQQAKERSI